MSHRLTTAAELAEEWGISEADLHKRRRRFNWPCVRLGRFDVRFTESQIAQIIDKQTEIPRQRSGDTGQTARSKGRAS